MFSKKPLCVAGIVTALTWPASLLTVASVIDNPWGVCLHRSAEVGKHLAHILLSRQQVTGRNYPGITARRELAQGGEVLQSCWVHGIFLGRQKLIKQKLTEVLHEGDQQIPIWLTGEKEEVPSGSEKSC